MSKFRMSLDVSRCIGCRACEVACVTANGLNPGVTRNWVPYLEPDEAGGGRAIFAPYLCHQCEDPPCVPACPTGASFIAADGRVLVDRDLCIGCGMCVGPCPYEARKNDPIANKLEKCTLCEGRVLAGFPPACFSTCPAGARHFEEEIEIDGEIEMVSVGNVEEAAKGVGSMRLTDDNVDPKPRLSFTGNLEDLRLLRTRRPPKEDYGLASSIWRGGAGLLVQVLGYVSMTAMAGMVGLRFIRSRKEKVASSNLEGLVSKEADGHGEEHGSDGSFENRAREEEKGACDE